MQTVSFSVTSSLKEASRLEEAMIGDPGAQAATVMHCERHQDTHVILKVLVQCKFTSTADADSNMNC